MFGLQIQATVNATLVSVRYPNQGKGATVALRNSANATLFTTNVPVGSVNPVIPVNVSLTAGQTYRLVALTASNNKFANFNAFPLSDGVISVTSSWGDTVAGTAGAMQVGFWASFNDIVTTAGVLDTDGDGITDPMDNCPTTANPTQINTDGDAQGDNCKAD